MHNIDPLLKDFISEFRRESGLNLKLDSSLGEQIYSAHTHNAFGKAWPTGRLSVNIPSGSAVIAIAIFWVKTTPLCPNHLAQMYDYITGCQKAGTAFSRSYSGYAMVSVFGEVCGVINEDVATLKYLESLCSDNVSVFPATKKSCISAINKFGVADDVLAGE